MVLLPPLSPAEAAAKHDETVGDLPVWRLDDLYAGTEAALADAEQLARDAAAFAAGHEGRIAELAEGEDAASRLHDAIRTYEDIKERVFRLFSYAGLVYATDSTDPAHAKFYGDVQDRGTAINAALVFFTLELVQVDDAVLEPLLDREPLAAYAPWLRDIRLWGPYRLSKELEKLLNQKERTGRAAWNRLFDETMARLRFSLGGKEVTSEEALHVLTVGSETARKEAFGALTETFKAALPTFTLITNTLAKDKHIEDTWRGFEDPAHAQHLDNVVEPEVVDALSDAVTAAYPKLSHRYYALKARWLEKDKLDIWDRNAVLPGSENRLIAWPEARHTVLSAYRDFSPPMAAIAERFFESGWIDAGTRPGKAPGAFSHPTVPSAHPYVLLNYQGSSRDVMTLAHELGHGVHQVLAADQGLLLSQTPLTLAETASVFGEMLTFRRLLAEAPDQKLRRVMLASKVEDMLNTVVRQIAFYTFERRLHLARRDGELRADDIGALWLDVQSESLGPAVTLNDGYETFWCYIPHFVHTPFYVYAYAFGDCLVNSLYAVYQDAEEGFAEKYIALLKAGGSKRHGELLAPFGLDAHDPAFWQKGLSLIASFIDELEAMEAG